MARKHTPADLDDAVPQTTEIAEVLAAIVTRERTVRGLNARKAPLVVYVEDMRARQREA